MSLFLSRVFSCACEMFAHSSELRIAHMSFVHRYVSLQRARVLARQLLRTHSNDLKLWHAYADMERRQGNLDEVCCFLIVLLEVGQRTNLAVFDCAGAQGI